MRIATITVEDNCLKEKQITDSDTNRLEALQEIVGGYIERVPIQQLDEKHITILCNEEGKLKGMLPTLAILSKSQGKIIEALVGDLIFIGYNDDGDFVSLTEEQLQFLHSYIIEGFFYRNEEGQKVSIRGIMI